MHSAILLAAWTVADQISLGAAIISLLALGVNIYSAVHSWRSSRAAQADAKKVADQSQMLQQQALLLAMGTSEADFMDKLNGAVSAARNYWQRCSPWLRNRRRRRKKNGCLDRRRPFTDPPLKAISTCWKSVANATWPRRAIGMRSKRPFARTCASNIEQKENEAVFNLFHPSDISRYTAIWQVYREWEKQDD